jgi:protein tyrosine phosphatase (PTP) superfamily phosphohydrolase (DUF442 family)
MRNARRNSVTSGSGLESVRRSTGRAILLAVASGAVSVVSGLPGCIAPRSESPIHESVPSMAAIEPVDRPGLHNLVAYHDGFVSGGAPEGDDGFDSLAAMGVVTIISVDGAVPEVERATARGMRYIHLPIGYDGFDDDRRLELTRAVRDAIASGPVYLHCHHGKHRSAGAAAAVAVGLDWMTPDEATARMQVSGTSPRYRGLYLCAANATPVNARTLDAIDADFPEISTPDDFVDAMVEMDHALDHLKRIAAAGWTTPESHPDLVPAAEAGRLADLLRLASQGERAASEPDPDFAAWLARDAVRVARLEERLLAESIDVATLDAELAAIRSSCSACHAAHRD